jgi:hypothetical protein
MDNQIIFFLQISCSYLGRKASPHIRLTNVLRENVPLSDPKDEGQVSGKISICN